MSDSNTAVKQDVPSTSLGPSFRWLNLAQFGGAMNDNIFKLLTVFFGVELLGKDKSDQMSSWAGILLAIPFILFLPASGALADRCSKRSVILWAKWFEIVAMLLGVAAFATGHIAGAFVVLFLMACHSALFGPSKYGVLPEIVRPDQLSKANGWLMAFTFLAIIVGTSGATLLRETFGDRFAISGIFCVVIALAGTWAATRMERTPIKNPAAKLSPLFFRDAFVTMNSLRHDRFILLAVAGSAFFNFIGAFLQTMVIPYGIKQLGLSDGESGMMFLAAALGIGLGSVSAGKASGRNIEFGVVPLGAAAMGASTLALGLCVPGPVISGILLAIAGFGAGLFIVPIEAFIQWRSPQNRVGEVVAANNWFGWIGVLLAGGLGLGLSIVFHAKPSQGFILLGVLTLVLVAITIKLLPDFLVRFIAVLITKTLYRIKVQGLENLPIEGGALLVANHVSYMDAVQILACQQRRIRFVMDRDRFEKSRLKPLMRLMGVIPISTEDSPKKLIESLRAARAALDDGYIVCVFAEGALTTSGLMRDFRPGFERIVKNSTYPIIPAYIGGTWGSIFSHYYGPEDAKIPRQFPYPCTVIFGSHLPATAKAYEVRQAVMELSTRYFEDRKAQHPSLGRTWIRTARSNWKRHAMSDTTGRRLTFGETLIGTLALMPVLADATAGRRNVGVLLPPSCGGAMVNIALTMLRKVAVNLNFTASKEAFQFALKAAELDCIITSTAFLEKMPDLAGLPGLVKLDELTPRITKGAKIAALLRARLLPAAMLSPGGASDDCATIIFSSGTTGEPKGVMLSHHNILSNVESLSMVFRPRKDYDICATLPLFHSFGYTCGIWFPLLAGMSVSYHVSPLDAAKIAEVVRENRSTALFATPTFLLAYLRKAKPEDFKSLKYVVVGAEKLKPRVAEAFHERFGIMPLEGFGATELSPVAALSLPDTPGDGVYQPGRKPGSVGQPVPGVAVRIVDPDTDALLPPGQPGHMLIKGPNVMLGYLGKPQLTADTIRDGWYRTGDIATVDTDGFITITDRLSRFSKIGGEMVPHMAIEEEYLKGLGKAEPVLAVSSVPDEKKGERLVVLYTPAAGDPVALHALIEKSPVPNLWKPNRNAYFPIEALPLTGSGKLDVKTLRKMAQEAAAAQEPAAPAQA